ncbi:MAG: tetratricopeptide repeat protein [Thermodesulfobacteriota bacterium]
MAPEELIKSGRYEEAIEVYLKALTEAKENQEKAKLHKALGDLWALKEDFKQASKEYLQALSLDKEGFTEEERFQMAICLSWGKQLDKAIKELSDILHRNPYHLEAKIHLARCLSWTGRLGESLRQIGEVLQRSPRNREALSIKANVLRWRGDYKKAMEIYRNLLQEKEDFDVRLGLTYLLLNKEDRRGVQRNLRLLTPLYSYQERELKILSKEIQERFGPFFEARYQFYKDSDHNRLNRYSIFGGGWFEQVRWNLYFRHTGAKDRLKSHRSEELSFQTYSRVFETLSLGGGLGIGHLRHRKTNNFLTGNAYSRFDFFRGTLGLTLSRDLCVDTAELIENRVRITGVGGSFFQNIDERLSFYGSYVYKDYSDSNRSHDFQFLPRYTIMIQNPRVTLGYRFRYLDFEKQTRRGYFDPENFISHQLLVSLDHKESRYSIFLEPYFGYQSYKRYGKRNHDFITGGTGIFQCRVWQNLNLEMAIEGGNYAIDNASGYKNFQITLGLKTYF